MLRIGITGGIGAGKSTATSIFSTLGVPIIDADVIAHELTQNKQPTLKEIVAHFGSSILDHQKNLDRRALRKIIFTHPDEKIWLENLLHPLIIDEMKRRLDEANVPYCLVSAPLLLETENAHTLVDRVLVIDASPESQIARTEQRDNIDKDQVERIMTSQLSREERLKQADDVIENNGNVENLIDQIKKLHDFYLMLSNPSSVQKASDEPNATAK